MKFNYTFKTAIKGLSANKSRSALTILGIVIGITAIMMVMSLGKGAQDLILGQLQSFGSKTIIVHPGREAKGPADFAQMFSDSLKERDLEALQKKSNAPSIISVQPLNVGGAVASYGNETYQLTIFASTQVIARIYNIKIGEGRFIDDDDVKNKNDAVVIGSKVKEELFGAEDALNKKIKIKGRNFRVIGVLPKKGQVSFINFDESAFLPYTTAQQYIFGIKYFHHIIAEAASENVVNRAVEEIKTVLRNNHDITDPSKDDFWIITQASAIEQVNTITNILTIFLTAVAAISLIVGGVGIMNIMLVSVTERTREIGLRKALGATESNIMAQFLLEAVILTATGGVIGIILGLGLGFVISFILSTFYNLNWGFTFPTLAIILGLGVSMAVGLGFGLYPAKQAAKKSPIEALRYE